MITVTTTMKKDRLPKINAGIFLKSCLLLLLCFTINQANSQLEKRQITPAEEKDFKDAQPLENNLLKLSAKDKVEGRDQAQATLAYVFKAVLNRDNETKYPIDLTENSPQSAIRDAVKDLSAYTFNKLRDKVTAMMTDPAKRATILGKFKDINFQKRSIHADINKIIKIPARTTVVRDRDDASIQPFTMTRSAGVGGTAANMDAPAYSKLDMVLRAVHCVDETNPESGDDDIVVGGVIIGCSGNIKSVNTLTSCHFDDNEYCNHGAYLFGTYNLGNQSNCPWSKTFYAVLQLVESDTDEQETAQAVTDLMKMVAAALAGTGYGAILAAVAEAVSILSGVFFDDDAFIPYGITLTISGPNVWGSDGRSNNWATGNITDHGGTYRLGFYYQLK